MVMQFVYYSNTRFDQSNLDFPEDVFLNIVGEPRRLGFLSFPTYPPNHPHMCVLLFLNKSETITNGEITNHGEDICLFGLGTSHPPNCALNSIVLRGK